MKRIILDLIAAAAAYLLFTGIPDIPMDRNTAFGYIVLYYVVARMALGNLMEIIREEVAKVERNQSGRRRSGGRD